MSSALNGSSAIRRFEGSDAIEIRDEIRDEIAFDFYTGLPHILSALSSVISSSQRLKSRRRMAAVAAWVEWFGSPSMIYVAVCPYILTALFVMRYFMHFESLAKAVFYDSPNALTIDATPGTMYKWPGVPKQITNFCLLPTVIPEISPKSKFIIIMLFIGRGAFGSTIHTDFLMVPPLKAQLILPPH